MPFGDYSIGAAVQREGPRLKNEDPEARGKIVHAHTYTITSDYFRTLGLTMLRGREFTAGRRSRASAARRRSSSMRALADTLFANENPIGQLLQYGADSGDARMRSRC